MGSHQPSNTGVTISSFADEDDERADKPHRIARVSDRQDPIERFRRLYDANYAPLFAYALRRTNEASEAHDVVADTFLVLWRRLNDAPPDEEVSLWLYGVARRVLANRQRARFRSERLVVRLGQVAPAEADTEELLAQRDVARAALSSLGKLRADDREILLLAAWEKLSAAEIGLVIGCSPNAAAIRLHRARKRLTEVFKKENGGDGDMQSEGPHLRRPRSQRREA